MKGILILMMLAVAGCTSKRDENKVAMALNAVQQAAWQVAVDRDDADRRDATAADAVDYTQAIAALNEAEKVAADRGATAWEISERRNKGQREGRKFSAGLRIGR